MKLNRPILTTFAALIVASNTQAQDARSAVGGILISPLLHRVAAKAGQNGEITFTLENPSQKQETLEGSLSSFTVEEWSYRTLYDQPHVRDCREWFSQQTIAQPVNPGQRMDVRLKFAVPRNADGPYWCMLKLTPRPSGSTTKALITYEVPVVIVVNKNPKPVLNILSPTITSKVSRDNKKSYIATLPIENTSGGFTPIGATGELRNVNTGRIVASMRLDDRNLLPGTKRNISFLLPALADGKYKLSFKTIMGSRALPAVTSEYSVVRGAPASQTEAASMSLTPISVEPSGVNATIPAGGSRTVVVKVRNNGSQPLPLEVQTRSVEQALNGSIGLGDAAPAKVKVEIAEDKAPLAPGETRILRLQIGVEAGAGGDLWFGLSMKEAGNGKALAEAVYGTVSVPNSAKPLIAIADPIVMKDGAAPVAVKFKVQNSGNVALRPDPSAAILEGGIRLVERPAVPIIGDGGLLPGGVIENTIMIPPGLKPGDYVVEISYQYGDSDFARVRVPIKIATPVKKKGGR